MTVAHLHLVVLHRAFVVLHRPLVLQHQLFLVFQRLARDRILRPCLLIALQVHLRLGQQILIAFQGPLRLRQLRLVRPRIDIDQRIALLDHLALAIMHFRDDTRDLSGDRIRVHRGDRPDGWQIDAQAARFRGCGNHRNRSRDHPATTAAARSRRLALLVLCDDPVKEQAEGDQNHRPNPAVTALPLGRRGGRR